MKMTIAEWVFIAITIVVIATAILAVFLSFK